MPDLNELESRLQAIEEQLAFQEDTVDQLNQMVALQSAELGKLWEANRLLKQKLEDSSPAEGEDGPPPHY